MLNVDNLYDESSFQLVHYVEQALRAHAIYARGRDYVLFRDGRVVDGRDRRAEVVIVDEFTGRLMHGRRYSEGLHQAIEAKESVEVQRESQTMATVTFQNYFRMYDKLAGMTGTAKTEELEFQSIYDLNVTVVPTNLDMVRDDRADLVYRTAKARDEALIDSLAEVHGTGQPVLVGTTSIEKSEALSQRIQRRGIPHNVLNAKYHAQEAVIVADAGREGAVTIATNMAGRGTDIILGGKPRGSRRRRLAGRARPRGGPWRPLRLGNRTPRSPPHRQPAPRSLRPPGRPGFFAVLPVAGRRPDAPVQFRQDQGRHATPRRRGARADRERHGLPRLESAQTKVEAHNYETRKYVLEFDNVINQQRGVIYDQRERVLNADDLEALFLEMLGQEVEHMVDAHGIEPHTDAAELEELIQAYAVAVGVDGQQPTPSADLEGLKGDDVAALLSEDAEQRYRQRLADFPPELAHRLLRWMMLQTIDYLWVGHLTAIEDVRQGIGLRAYGQQDPLVAFKREAFHMFSELIASIRADIVRRFFRVQMQDPLQEETVLTRHRDSQAALPAETADRPEAAAQPARATNGAGQAPRLSRRQRRAQERARKKRNRRRSRQRIH